MSEHKEIKETLTLRVPPRVRAILGRAAARLTIKTGRRHTASEVMTDLADRLAADDAAQPEGVSQ